MSRQPARHVVQDGESLGTALGSNSELSLGVVRAATSPSLSAERLPQELPNLSGPNFFRVDRLLVTQDAVCCDFLRCLFWHLCRTV